MTLEDFNRWTLVNLTGFPTGENALGKIQNVSLNCQPAMRHVNAHVNMNSDAVLLYIHRAVH